MTTPVLTPDTPGLAWGTPRSAIEAPGESLGSRGSKGDGGQQTSALIPVNRCRGASDTPRETTMQTEWFSDVGIPQATRGGGRRPQSAQPRWQGPATGDVTKEEIEKLLESGVPTEVVTHLRRRQIEVATDGVFQWRDREEHPERKAHHIGVLVHDLRITGKPFDPLVVFPAGGRYFVMEGHHRLAAYEAVNWSDPASSRLPLLATLTACRRGCSLKRLFARHGGRRSSLRCSRCR
jgi:hypothetical protein